MASAGSSGARGAGRDGARYPGPMISRSPRTRRQQSLTGAKLAFAIVGLLTWAYGVYADAASVRWLGIAFFVAAFLLRFVYRRGPPAG